MYVERKDIIQAPVDEVYALVRDQLPLIVPYLPNVKKVEVKNYQRSADGQETHITNHWYAAVEVPAMVQSFISAELFSWKDTAIWKDKDKMVEYNLESFWANDLYDALGKNYFRALNDHETELRVTCDLKIHAHKVPGVPRLLVNKVLPTIEAMIEKIVGPNLSGLGNGINAYLKSRQ